LRSTIRSRCLRITFQPVEQTLIRALLAREKKLPEAQRALAARVAAGSVARARSFDPGEYQRRRQPWLEFLEATVRGNTPGAPAEWRQLFDSARALAENRDDFEETLKIGYSLLADLLHVSLDSTTEAVVNIDLTGRLLRWAPKLTLRGIEKLKAGLDQANRLQVRNVNPQLGFETLGLDVALSIDAGKKSEARS
jgi:DNA polymerase-3 subunit delta'